jgi:hypothetical protein
MRWATFDRRIGQNGVVETVCGAHLLRFIQKPIRRPSTWLK